MTWTPTRLIGYNAKLATQVAGTPPTNTDVAGLQSGDFNASVKMIDVTTVDDAGTDYFLPGSLSWGFTGKFALIAGDATQAALMTSLLAKTPLLFVYFPIQTAAASGAPSYVGQCYIESMKLGSGGTSAGQTLDITLKGIGAFTEVAQ